MDELTKQFHDLLRSYDNGEVDRFELYDKYLDLLDPDVKEPANDAELRPEVEAALASIDRIDRR